MRDCTCYKNDACLSRPKILIINIYLYILIIRPNCNIPTLCFFVTVTCYIYDKTTKNNQTICHLITNKSITSYPFSYSYCKRPQRESIKRFCEINIEICDSNIIVTCNSYKNVRLYLLQNVIFLKYANFFSSF